MKTPLQTFWFNANDNTYYVLDQRALPHEVISMPLKSISDVIYAIEEMVVRGAPLIGITAAVGMLLIMQKTSLENAPAVIERTYSRLLATRPTAINLKWALDEMRSLLLENPSIGTAKKTLMEIIQLETDAFRQIASHGMELIRQKQLHLAQPVQILTHCNAGWLACIKYGTALAPIYRAHEEGIPVHVWIDETRPLNQGARLTAWELKERGIPHTLIVDNAGGHLMQKGLIDFVFVGADRVSKNGDVANKIGTYLKALAAVDNQVPFYVVFPSSTFDWEIENGMTEIPIEERNAYEVTHVCGWDGKKTCVRIAPEDTPVANPAFDITPAKLITGLLTEKGVFPATSNGIQKMYPEKF